MNKTIMLSGILLGALAVVLGAFGAHGLKELLPGEALESFNTGVRYQMYHALLLLVLGSMRQLDEARKKWVFYLLLSGVVCFSFSIYLLATSSLTGIYMAAIGVITPLGGILLISGWLLLAYRIFKPLG